jgi:hypothetical protein
VGVVARIRFFGVVSAVLLTGLVVASTASATTFSWSAPAAIDTASQMHGISCPATDLCVAVDDNGVVTTTDPTGGAAKWTPIIGNGEQAIDCPSKAECVAGSGAGAITTSTNPTGGPGAWDTVNVDGLQDVMGVSCPTTNLCFGVDDSGDVAFSNNPTNGGGTWSVVNIDGTNTLNGISCPTITLCVATDVNGDVLTSTTPTSLNASAWTDTHIDGNTLYGISCPATTLCAAGDAGGDVVTSTNPTGGAADWKHRAVTGASEIATISCPTTTECVGGDITGDVVDSDDPTHGATAWHLQNVDAARELSGMSCPTVALCLAVDLNDNVLAGQATAVLTVTEAGSGAGTVTSSPAGINCPTTCAGSFPLGKSVTLKASASGSSVFAGWSGAPGCAASTTCVVDLASDTTVTATFNKSAPPPPGKHNLTVVLTGTGSGQVSGTGISCPGTCVNSYNNGAKVTLTASPAGSSGFTPASTFTGWSGGGCSGTGTCTVTLNAGVRVTATFTLEPYALAVAGVTPASGSEDGGTEVTVTGTGFEPGSSVEFGQYYATGVTVDSYTTLTAVAPPGTGTRDVRVVTGGHKSPGSAGDKFTYVTASAPAVTLLAPSEGAEHGGYKIYIWGKDFDNATSVTIGGTTEACGKGQKCGRISPTELSARAPAGHGTVRVIVHTPLGTSPSNGYDVFTYVGRPVVGFVQGNPVPAATGGPVVIQASGIDRLKAIHVGKVRIYAYTLTGPNSIAFFVPPGRGAPHITVTAAGGTSAETAADVVHYYTVPLVTAVSSNSGPEPGGYQTRVIGENFARGMSVHFGAAAARVVRVSDHSVATVVVPPGHGSEWVTATVDGRTSPLTTKFGYIPPPPPCLGGSHGPFEVCNVSAWASSSVAAISIGETDDSYIAAEGSDAQPPPNSPPLPNVAVHSTANADNANGNAGGVASSFGLQAENNASGFPTADFPGPVALSGVSAGLQEEWHLSPAPGRKVKLQIVIQPHALAASGDGADYFHLILRDVHCVSCVPVINAEGTDSPGYVESDVSINGKRPRRYRRWAAIVVPFTVAPGEYPAFDLLETFSGGASAQCGYDFVYACYGDTAASLDPVIVSDTPGYTVAPNFSYQGTIPVLTGPQAASARRGSHVTLTGMALGSSPGRVTVEGADGRSVAAQVGAWSDRSVTATVPRGVALGQALISIATGAGVSSNKIPVWIGDGRPAPSVRSVSPSIARAGTRVRVVGDHLRAARAVLFGGRRARRLRVLSPHVVEATVPRGASSGDVSVLTPAGTSPVSTGSEFTYLSSSSRRLGPKGGTLSLPGGIRLLVLPTELRRRTRVTLSLLAPSSVHGRLRRAARRAAVIVRVQYGHRPARAPELQLPGSQQDPNRPSLSQILGPDGGALVTSFPDGFTATAPAKRGGDYALVRSR